MSRLKGFMSTKDNTKIATIAVDKEQKKEILPTKFDSKSAAQTTYTRPCLSHANSPVVTVDLMEFDQSRAGGKVWKKIAEGKCCPLCWQVLKRIDDESKWT